MNIKKNHVNLHVIIENHLESVYSNFEYTFFTLFRVTVILGSIRCYKSCLTVLVTLLSTAIYIYLSSYRIKSFHLWMHSMHPGSPYEGRHLLEFSITTHVTLYKHAIPAVCEGTTYRQYSFVLLAQDTTQIWLGQQMYWDWTYLSQTPWKLRNFVWKMYNSACCFVSVWKSHHKNHENSNIKTANRSFENVAKFKYLEMTVNNQNSINEGIKLRLFSGNACYCSVQNL
jgi:hypothetical protein